ncbi:hypothetical protein PROFUN_10129 [Planoprotostelium fungivorum]|uniref:Uncharacterized protein n=1 Tax=Planoprotostelium fungivorum TaxID=1890364 RepID=A0A2P6NEP3_9EUKA|nr:hypothetical protein PROFUN_10129 [Planoprotostelium fungivorum]
MNYDFIKLERTEPKIFHEMPISQLLNYLTQDNIIELIDFPVFNSLNEQFRHQTGKVSLAAVKMLADNEQFQVALDENPYNDPDAKYEQYKIVPYMLQPPPRMKIQHLLKGIRECVSRSPGDYLDKELASYNNKKQCMKMNRFSSGSGFKFYSDISLAPLGAAKPLLAI